MRRLPGALVFAALALSESISSLVILSGCASSQPPPSRDYGIVGALGESAPPPKIASLGASSGAAAPATVPPTSSPSIEAMRAREAQRRQISQLMNQHDYEGVLKIDPMNSMAWRLAIEQCVRQGKYQQAVDYFQRPFVVQGVTLRPRYDVFPDAIIAYERLGNTAEALRLFVELRDAIKDAATTVRSPLAQLSELKLMQGKLRTAERTVADLGLRDGLRQLAENVEATIQAVTAK